MKVVQINSVCENGSTGRICVGIKNETEANPKNKNVILFFYGKKSPYGKKISNIGYQKTVSLISRVTGLYGFIAKRNTKRVIKFLDKYAPDIVHLHNIHDQTIDLKMLFSFLNRNKIRIVWTFHDCWGFTGYCAHFMVSKCQRWKYECCDCPSLKGYSWFFDNSNYLFNKKKELFQGSDITIVTPSMWLAGLVKESFLSSKKTIVINNGIDLFTFKHTESNFREVYSLQNKKIILGVSYVWSTKKGIKIFNELADTLDEDFKIVLVGDVDKESIVSSKILHIFGINNQEELSKIYSAADLFFNPTYEDTFPTVNIESLACGTPVVSFDTGGCLEIIDKKCGEIINKNQSINFISERLMYIIHNQLYSFSACIERAQQFNKQNKFRQYVELYEDIL